jgi:hypothetical protein
MYFTALHFTCSVPCTLLKSLILASIQKTEYCKFFRPFVVTHTHLSVHSATCIIPRT